MKRTVIFGVMLSVSLFAFEAKVKKADVILSVNGGEKVYTKDTTFTLQHDDIVCFVSGEGKVVIRGENYKKQLSKRSKHCKHLIDPKNNKIDYVTMVEKGVGAIVGVSQEGVVHGVSRKAVTTETDLKDIHFKQGSQYLLLENNTWGPLPVTLELLDEKGNVVERMVNEEDIFTSFVLPETMLKEGYTVKVTNAFDEVLVKSVIHRETGK